MPAAIAVTAVLLMSLWLPIPARACGGCISPPDVVTTVDSHRMAIAVSPEKSVLWDQIRYSGDPEDFVWILPIPPVSVEIEIADPAFLDELDGGTAPVVRRPPTDDSTGVGCGAGAAIADFEGYGAGGGVVVYDEDVVGPYATVTLSSDDPQALYIWLDENDYAVDGSIRSSLDHYVEGGYHFVIMRLAPGQGVGAMQPVRVTYPGAMTVFPLKMVAVGARGSLALSLWVFAEQRYEAANYANARIVEEDLRFPIAAASSNYDSLFSAAIDDAGGRAWITEYAGPLPYFDIGWEEETRVRDVVEYPYVTRLRTEMLVDYLDEDLKLTPARDASDVSNILQARDLKGEALGTVGVQQGGAGCVASSLGRLHPLWLALVGGVIAVGRIRRRRK